MDEPEGNHAKVNKPATERQIHDAAYMGYGKQPNPQKQTTGLWLSEAEERDKCTVDNQQLKNFSYARQIISRDLLNNIVPMDHDIVILHLNFIVFLSSYVKC